MSDLISRKALCEYALNQKDKSITPNDIMRFPSAQPEKRTEKHTETHACDLISRQAAIDAHYEYCNKHPDAGFPVWSLKILEKLPSAQPEVLACGEGELIAQPQRKKGKWIEQDDSWDGVYYECSACGEPWTTIDGTPWDNGMNFCPHCGAEMTEEHDGKSD